MTHSTAFSVSVIVTARDAQGHLRDCLDSILRQSGQPEQTGHSALELDIIGVDNASTDATAAIFDEYAECDGRVRAIHLPQRLPQGEARDAGAQQADGGYLLFLDGCDTLVPGALAALARRAAEAGGPDVLLFDHVRTHWSNPAIPSGDAKYFQEPGRDVFAVASHPELLHTTPSLANRLLRSGFYRAHPELFTQDDYEAALPGLGSLLAAQRIALHDAVCVRLREPQDTAPEGYFTLFTQYERLWELLEGPSITGEQREIVFSGQIRRYLKVLTLPGMTEQEQVEFFRAASRHFRRFRPADYRRPANLNGVRHSMLERGSFSGYRALQAANRKRRVLRTVAGKAKQVLGEKARDGAYRELMRLPLEEDLAVFSAYWDRGLACSPAAISAKLAELSPGIRQLWVVRRANVPLIPPGVDYIVPGTRRYWMAMARAKYFVNNVNFPDTIAKRPGQIHVQTHHGTPLKRMGVDQIPFPATSRGEDYEALLERCARWDYSVSANQHSTETWQRAYPVPFTSLDYGYPRNDVFYRATAADVLRVRERLGIPSGRKAVLYCPTHRDYEAEWVPRLDLERLAGCLGDDFVLLVRGHYFYDRGLSPLEELHRRGVIIDVSSYDSVEELCLASDALITDYSSVMFDYANLDRPIVIFADDWETYSATRGVYFDLTENSPGVVARSQHQIEEVFTSGAWYDEQAAANRTAFRRKFCTFDDGHAAERVVRHVFLNEKGISPILPVGQRTPAPTPDKAAVVGPLEE
jgi:CDP-glycerol glycerophosphotransferase